MKRERLLADICAWGEKEMDQKKGLADGRVKRYALASAASGLSPVPGTDVLIDLSLLIKMNHEILHIFGLTEKQAEYLGTFGTNASALTQRLIRDLGKLMSKEAVSASVKTLSSASGSNSGSKNPPPPLMRLSPPTKTVPGRFGLSRPLYLRSQAPRPGWRIVARSS